MSLISIIRKITSATAKADPLGAKILEATKDAPGSAGSLYAAIQSGASTKNLYGEDRGFWDIFAGGDAASQNASARAIGRTVGTAAAGYALGGAAGAGTSGRVAAASEAVNLASGMTAQAAAQRAADEEASRQRELLAAIRGEQAKEPPIIPIADEEAQRLARRRSLAGILQRRGRASTILTGGGSGDRLGA